jgi:hypothetical protein
MVKSPCSRVDAFRLEMSGSDVGDRLKVLEDACENDGDIFPELDDLSWSTLDATLAAASPEALYRSAKLAGQHEEVMSPVHRRITDAIRFHARDALSKRLGAADGDTSRDARLAGIR